MPPAFFVPNTARHCHPRRWPLPCNLPLPFPLYSQFGLYALPLHSNLCCMAALVLAASATPTFTAPLLLIWQK